MERENIYDKKSGVIELTKKDFKDGKIKNRKHAGLIAFYAPWCPHCRMMKEMWIELAYQFKNLFWIGAVNCEKNRTLCIQHKIRQYPIIKYVNREGVLSDYTGSIQKDDFIYFICEKI